VRASFALLALALLAGCGGGSGGGGTTAEQQPSSTEAHVGSGRGGVRLDIVGTFNSPVYVTQPPGNSDDVFVVEQGGQIQVVHAGSQEQEPFLDISSEISTSGTEQGLLSMAFAPDYEQSGRFYVDFTDISGNIQVAEFKRSKSSGLIADPESRRDVLQIEHPNPIHNGGLVLFGPDGKLYIGVGDGGPEEDPEGNGQSLETLLGKILRIDPRPRRGKSYTVPPDNPFTDKKGARPEIYSYGLRNPWRFSFDRDTGALSIGDVGQETLEEINYVERSKGSGANFGWSAFEGTDRFNEDQRAPHAIAPVLTYKTGESTGPAAGTSQAGATGQSGGVTPPSGEVQAGSTCAVTGGYVVRDRSLKSLYGRYVYGDFCSGELSSFVPAIPKAKSNLPLRLRVPSLSSFGEDNTGHIYVTSLDGSVYQLIRETGSP
jgi:glucose/arabinose dehydrogenase